LLFFLTAYGLPVTTHYAALALVLVTEFVFVLGVSCLCSAVTPFFPDLMIIIQSGMQLLFFLSGVFYQIDTIPPPYRQWFFLNPMVTIIEGLRAVLLYHQWPSFENLTYVLCFSLIIVFSSYGIIRKFERAYPRIVMS
jgi:lipopolysaccharide transport system permease protein